VDGGGGEAEAVSNPHPYLIEVYVARDESETCLTLNQLKTFVRRTEP
jgi:hypothetical protein